MSEAREDLAALEKVSSWQSHFAIRTRFAHHLYDAYNCYRTTRRSLWRPTTVKRRPSTKRDTSISKVASSSRRAESMLDRVVDTKPRHAPRHESHQPCRLLPLLRFLVCRVLPIVPVFILF